MGNLSIAGESESTEIDVLEIAGKSQQDVENLLGIPQSCKKSYLGESCRFKGGRIDIEFINGKADWIGIGFQAVDVEFDYRSISHIGLTPVPPIMHNPFVMHWQGHHGLEVVTVYSRGKYVGLIQVRAITVQ
jgi:hypothetical protein